MAGVTLSRVYAELRAVRAEMVRREELEALIDQPGFLASAATRAQLRASRRDVAARRVRVVRSVKDLLG